MMNLQNQMNGILNPKKKFKKKQKKNIIPNKFQINVKIPMVAGTLLLFTYSMKIKNQMLSMQEPLYLNLSKILINP